MPRWINVAAALSLFLGGCEPERLKVELAGAREPPSSLVIIASVQESRIESLLTLSPGESSVTEVGNGVEDMGWLSWTIPTSSFTDYHGNELSDERFSGIRAVVGDEEARELSACGFWGLPTAEAPFPVRRGDVTPVPPFAQFYNSRESDSALGDLIDDVRLVWPGDCECRAPGLPRARPTLGQESQSFVPDLAVTSSAGTVLLRGSNAAFVDSAGALVASWQDVGLRPGLQAAVAVPGSPSHFLVITSERAASESYRDDQPNPSSLWMVEVRSDTIVAQRWADWEPTKAALPVPAVAEGCEPVLLIPVSGAAKRCCVLPGELECTDEAQLGLVNSVARVHGNEILVSNGTGSVFRRTSGGAWIERSFDFDHFPLDVPTRLEVTSRRFRITSLGRLADGSVLCGMATLIGMDSSNPQLTDQTTPVLIRLASDGSGQQLSTTPESCGPFLARNGGAWMLGSPRSLEIDADGSSRFVDLGALVDDPGDVRLEGLSAPIRKVLGDDLVLTEWGEVFRIQEDNGLRPIWAEPDPEAIVEGSSPMLSIGPGFIREMVRSGGECPAGPCFARRRELTGWSDHLIPRAAVSWSSKVFVAGKSTNGFEVFVVDPGEATVVDRLPLLPIGDGTDINAIQILDDGTPVVTPTRGFPLWLGESGWVQLDVSGACSDEASWKGMVRLDSGVWLICSSSIHLIRFGRVPRAELIAVVAESAYGVDERCVEGTSYLQSFGPRPVFQGPLSSHYLFPDGYERPTTLSIGWRDVDGWAHASDGGQLAWVQSPQDGLLLPFHSAIRSAVDGDLTVLQDIRGRLAWIFEAN